MLDVFGLFSVPTLYVLIGISVLLIVAIILSIVAIAKSSAMKKKYNIMMEGSEGKSIEKIMRTIQNQSKIYMIRCSIHFRRLELLSMMLFMKWAAN